MLLADHATNLETELTHPRKTTRNEIQGPHTRGRQSHTEQTNQHSHVSNLSFFIH